MFSADEFLNKALEKRRAENAFRSLSVRNNLIDFCSNDYLGFARSAELKARVEAFHTDEQNLLGSTGSRLLKGNYLFAEALEQDIALFHRAEAGLIYNSGYDANIGLFSSVPQEGDTVLYDELIHASIHDGMRLNKADRFPVKHNDLNHLEQRLSQAKGTVYIAVESVYSMDGDAAPLKEMLALCKKYSANLIVDEAHATGFFGVKGEGRVVELGLENEVFARVHTFGKALGCHGAIVLGSKILRDYLINFSRSFIYTTALPLQSLIAVKCAYDMLSVSNNILLKTNNLITLFKQKMKLISGAGLIASNSSIQCLIMPGNDRVKAISSGIQNAGFDVRPILSPTVSKGKERMRICIHAFNTEEEIEDLVSVLKKNISQ